MQTFSTRKETSFFHWVRSNFGKLKNISKSEYWIKVNPFEFNNLNKGHWSYEIDKFMKTVKDFWCYPQTQANHTSWPLQNQTLRNQIVRSQPGRHVLKTVFAHPTQSMRHGDALSSKKGHRGSFWYSPRSLWMEARPSLAGQWNVMIWFMVRWPIRDVSA